MTKDQLENKYKYPYTFLANLEDKVIYMFAQQGGKSGVPTLILEENGNFTVLNYSESLHIMAELAKIKRAKEQLSN